MRIPYYVTTVMELSSVPKMSRLKDITRLNRRPWHWPASYVEEVDSFSR